jgi:SAM-dependent methyltransferase
MNNLLIRAFGWRATMFHGDPCVVDRWAFARRQLRPGPARTLDAGAGNGGFALMAASAGNSVLGLSFSNQEMTEAQSRATLTGLSGASFRIGDLRELEQFGGELGTFDQILCLEVIEHLYEDQLLIERLARLLRPGGRLIISAPSADHRALLGEGVSATEDGGHVRWGYRPERVAEIVESAGLTLVAQGATSGFISQQLTNLMRFGQRRGRALGWALVLPLRPLQLLDRPLTRLLRWPYLSVTAVAEAPRSISAADAAGSVSAADAARSVSAADAARSVSAADAARSIALTDAPGSIAVAGAPRSISA